MTINEFSSLMDALGGAFNKKYTEGELSIYYRYFKEYEKRIFIKAIDELITKNDKLPNIRELLEKCSLMKTRIELDDEYKKIGTPEPDEEWYELLNSFKHGEKP